MLSHASPRLHSHYYLSNCSAPPISSDHPRAAYIVVHVCDSLVRGGEPRRRKEFRGKEACSFAVEGQRTHEVAVLDAPYAVLDRVEDGCVSVRMRSRSRYLSRGAAAHTRGFAYCACFPPAYIVILS